MTQLTSPTQVAGQNLFTSSAVQQHVLGEVMRSSDGRTYRYAKAGGVALVAGTLLQAPAEATGVQNLAVSATAAGSTTVTTTTTVTVTANEYAGGLVVVAVTPGVGRTYRISSHPAATAAVVTLTLEDPIAVALTTSSRIDLVKSPYGGVIINPTTATSALVGVAINPIAIGEYGWIQTGGVAAVLADGAITVGTTLIASNATAGAVEPGADAADLQAVVGIAATGIATTEYGSVKLLLD